ncbi:MAG: hypothetical protein KatS3mg056_0933 [Chloroflexus sp.]|nr:MAG: hypothetical protein KatS3mg056_0933 [Chloroflexus sp.]
MRARASGAPLTGTSLRQREPHPAPAVPAPSGGGPGWGRYPGSARLRRAPHQHQPAPAGASSGTGSSRPQRGRARVGAIPCERAPPARSSPAPACASGSLIRHRQFPPPAGAGQGGGDVMRACASGALTAWHPDWESARLQQRSSPGTSLHQREPHPAPAVPAPSGGGPGWGRCPASVRLRRAHRLASRLEARASSTLLTGTSLHQREPHPAPAVPAPSGGGPGWGRYHASVCLRHAPHRHQPAPTGASSGTGSSRPRWGRASGGRDDPGSARLRCAPHRHQPAPAGASSGTGSSRPQRGRARVGAIPCERAPPARSPPGIPTGSARLRRAPHHAPACASGSPHPAPAVPAPSGGGVGCRRTLAGSPRLGARSSPARA